MEKLGVGYIRVSKVGLRGEDMISPDLQRHAIESAAEREGVRIVEWVEDIDRSGRTFIKRRVQDVINGVEEGKWRYVFLWKWSRWGRNLKESLVHLARVEEVGGVVRAATEDFDPKTTMGRFTRDQMLLVAQLQSDMISDGWKEAQDARRRAGLPHTALPRWGYTYSRATGYVVDEGRRDVLRTAYEDYAAGKSHRAIALEWNAVGLRTDLGNTWAPVALARMMDNGFAAGLIREKSSPSAATKARVAIWDYDVWRAGSHEAIVSEETWKAYVARRQTQAGYAPRLRTAAHALSGLLKCGHEACFASMVMVYSGRARLKYWQCHRARTMKTHPSNGISDGVVTAAVLGWINANAEGGEDVTEQARRMEAGRQARVDGKRYEEEIRRLTNKRARLADGYTDGDIEREDYLAQKRDIEEQLQVAAEGLAAARAREEASGVDMVRQFKALAEEWPRLEPSLRREALSQVVRHIVIEPRADGSDRVRITPAWAA